ncbi:MAG: acyl carrier protein [Acidobacteriota bacterium]|nr:MAG: acyl carrier protein [Acidobacteriota bacterium]
MTREEIKARVLDILAGIAPEAETELLDPETDLREQLDIDSMDYLNFVIALDDEFNAGIPEKDYTKFTTIDSCVRQLETLGRS